LPVFLAVESPHTKIAGNPAAAVLAVAVLFAATGTAAVVLAAVAAADTAVPEAPDAAGCARATIAPINNAAAPKRRSCSRHEEVFTIRGDLGIADTL
jgi:hypothetical protein